jgi:hypothetical protein
MKYFFMNEIFFYEVFFKNSSLNKILNQYFNLYTFQTVSFFSNLNEYFKNFIYFKSN